MFLQPIPNYYPTFFYKYISFEKQQFVEDILKHSKLYFSFPNQFRENDAYDCRAYNFVVKTKRDMEILCKKNIEINYPNLSKKEKNKMIESVLFKYKEPDSPYYTELIANLNRVYKTGHDDKRI